MCNAQIVVWEHVCGGFLLLITMLDVCMMPEVVWKFVLLFVCTRSFVRQLCVTVHD